MDTEQIALIGGLVVGGIGAASPLATALVSWINGRNALRAQRSGLFIELLKERVQKLTELQIKLADNEEYYNTMDTETAINAIIAEITAIVYGTGYRDLVRLWQDSIAEETAKLEEKGPVSTFAIAKVYCEQALLAFGTTFFVWLEKA